MTRFRRREAWVVSVLGLAAVLAGCATQPGTIWRTFELEDGKSVGVDARQRIVTNNDLQPTSRPGLVNPRRIVCAEPSPDVAIAVANSFGASISVLGYGSGAVSGAQAEGLAQLAERTVTVQLLRDQMYRACEAYANGAISGTTYSLIMSKNNDAMVTLMLGEVAGGAFGRSLAAIGGGANAEAQAKIQGFGAVTGEFKQGVQDLQAANAKVAAAEEKLADKEKQLAAQQDNADDAVKAKNQKEVDDAKSELATAKAERDVVAEGLQSKSEAVAEAAADVRNLTPAGAIANRSSPEIAKVLGDMQRDFLREESFDDEYVSACVVELGLVQDPNSLDDLSFSDALDAYQAAQLAETDKEKHSRWHKRITEHRLATMVSMSARNRLSGLAAHCERYLIGFMTTAVERKFILDHQELQGRKLVNQKDALEEYNKAAAGCAAITDVEQQAQCRNTLARIVDPGADLVEIPVDPAALSGPVLPFDAFEVALEWNETLQTKETELENTTVPSVTSPEDDDLLKNQKESLKEAQDALKTDTKELLGKASVLLTTDELADIKSLDERWNSLESGRRRAKTDGDAAQLKRFRALITAQQIDAQVAKATYDELARELERQVKQIDRHIVAVEELKSKAE